MHINIFLILFIIILGLLFSTSKNSDKGRLAYIIICGVVLILVAALRSPEWMTLTYRIDTLVYQDLFEMSADYSWSYLWRYARVRGSEYDIGFLSLNKFIGLFTDSFYIYSIIADLVFFVPFCIILYRYTTKVRQLIFAFVFYVALIQIFFLGGARQMFAIGFDMMALLAVIDRKKWRAVIFMLLGVTIHFSSLLFLVPLLLVWYKVKPQTLKLAHAFCFIVFPIVLLFPQQVIVFMGNVSGLEKYSNYGMGEIHGGATIFILLIEFLSLLCLFFIKNRDMQKNPTIQLFYVMAPLFTLLAPLIHADGSMIRVSLYYHLYLALLVPYSMECMFKDNESRTIGYVVAVSALSLFTLMGGGIRYYFFWQY